MLYKSFFFYKVIKLKFETNKFIKELDEKKKKKLIKLNEKRKKNN